MKHPYQLLFEDVLDEALRQEVSDIHVEPTKDGTTIRFRKMGLLQKPYRTLGLRDRDVFVRNVKQYSGLPLDVCGTPQDGRFSYKTLNLRINALPTLYGDKLCLRLLPQNRKFNLESLHFEPDALLALKRVVTLSQGIVLIGGVTGSGKTTTLYALLHALDRHKYHVMTLEDPVEYELPGINQVPIQPHLRFSEVLRAMLRQDPDVIFVGEIRDTETAQLCFQAAATGHLVFSTIHADSPEGIQRRLLGLGVEKELISSYLVFYGVQSLELVLCPNCSGCTQCNHGVLRQQPTFIFQENLHD